jgi:fermentation-respiration switch protein FrsA (DUF1100 family)
LILEAGFPDARTLHRASPVMAFLSLFSTYSFSTVGFLQDVKVPVLVMHGDADQVIAHRHGQALYERISGPKQFVTLRGANHNEALPPDPAAYWQAVHAFIERLRS